MIDHGICVNNLCVLSSRLVSSICLPKPLPLLPMFSYVMLVSFMCLNSAKKKITKNCLLFLIFLAEEI